MFLNRLTLVNYKNFESSTFEFDTKLSAMQQFLIFKALKIGRSLNFEKGKTELQPNKPSNCVEKDDSDDDSDSEEKKTDSKLSF